MPTDKKLKKPKLTPKQEKFVDKYIELGNGAKAAREAGYSAHTADKIASENIRKPEIIASLAERKAKAAEKAGISLEWIFSKLKEGALLALANNDVKSFVNPIAEINKMQGNYEPAKSEVTEQINNDSLKELISQIKKDY